MNTVKPSDYSYSRYINEVEQNQREWDLRERRSELGLSTPNLTIRPCPVNEETFNRLMLKKQDGKL